MPRSHGPVKVVMVVEGMKVKPAGEVVEGTGHHHILINHGFHTSGTGDSNGRYSQALRERTIRKRFWTCLQVITN